MPTAYVTGATGFLGLNLLENLLARGFHVVAAHRQSSDLRYLARFDVERVVADVTDARAVLETMPDAVDPVFHGAGRSCPKTSTVSACRPESALTAC